MKCPTTLPHVLSMMCTDNLLLYIASRAAKMSTEVTHYRVPSDGLYVRMYKILLYIAS